MTQRLELLTEIDQTINLLEQEIPASPARNEGVEQGLRREMANYFKALDQAIDWTALEQIYYRNVKQE